MTQEEIRDERYRLELEIEMFEDGVKQGKAKLTNLQNFCRHPNKKLPRPFAKYHHCEDCNLTIFREKSQTAKPPS